jgi:two-component system sensor histidine kinase KdpD
VPGAGRASITIPLVAEEAPVGVLSLVVEDGARDFTDQDLDAMEVFAGHAAVAIVNARAYEKERELRERLAEVDAQRRESIAHLTHDLKAPLTSILGYAQLLARLETLEGDDARSYADTIQRQGHRIVEMVERLVIATRLEDSRPTLKRERLDIQRIVTEQVEALRGLLGERRVDLRIPVDLPAVWGDRSSVEHCLVNLLDNAVKYSPDGSTILVEVGTEESEIRIAVVDEGEGIPQDSLPSVFERYQRASEEGGMASVGLGLFIVQSLAQAQGGRALAENEPGKGARVTFTLPYRRDDR